MCKKYLLKIIFVLLAFYLPFNSLEASSKKKKNSNSKKFRTFDGSRNNKKHKNWGSANQTLVRTMRPNYADGVAQIASAGMPGARLISNSISAQDEEILSDRNLSAMLWQWGQFLDHDIDLTDSADPPDSQPIPVPAGDLFFDPFTTGNEIIPFLRSAFSEKSNPRQQMNMITSFIDASNVYGSDKERADALRTFEGGKLKTSDNNLLPFNTEAFANAGGDGNPNLFFAGDVRANEQIGLTCMHTLFVREHNRKAEEIAANNPKFSDEKIYQQTRKYLGALMQVITYNEFIPALMGENALNPYTGYNKKVNPGIKNIFSTAAYRFGHSTIGSEIPRLDNDGKEIPDGSLTLRNAFFRPSLLKEENDIGYILKGLSSVTMQEIDTLVVDDLRNFLFGPPGAGGMDLASLNIQRGRDHGLASYNLVRVTYGQKQLNSFSEISSNEKLNQILANLYGDVNSIDAWVGMLAEDHVAGASVGPTMFNVLKKQFESLRDGDRFWYQRTYKGKELAELEKTTLADIIKRNTQISNIQANAFFNTLK